tara:strand:+ start:148 stop:465 length:318 start_codon:yes stop_codon:yes gene_type:complete
MWHKAAETESAFSVRALQGMRRPARNGQYVRIPAEELRDVQANAGFKFTFAPFLVSLASVTAGTACGVAGGFMVGGLVGGVAGGLFGAGTAGAVLHATSARRQQV